MKRLTFRLYQWCFRWWWRIRRTASALRFVALLSAGVAVGAVVGAPIGHTVAEWALWSGRAWVLFAAVPLLVVASCRPVYGLMVAWKYR